MSQDLALWVGDHYGTDALREQRNDPIRGSRPELVRLLARVGRALRERRR